MQNPICKTFVLVVCYLLSSLFVGAQAIIDSTTDFSFGETRISELIKLREYFLYNDTAKYQSLLSVKGYSKIDSIDNVYINNHSKNEIEFRLTTDKEKEVNDEYQNKFILVYRNNVKQFKSFLEEFIRLQKLNEFLHVDEYSDTQIIGFFDNYLEKKFLINLHDNNYSLAIF